ncbi:MAG: mercury(II) reductase [Candidatus Thorarchaeota archaeon]|nr:MAG: mercury(II) reductase [Candidatus Thorarchaeota archaeon]RLI58850.1 MAG: mercury(II) reductase [Candidatus Thorarchaeota archaeon]
MNDDQERQEIRLRVTGMTCDSCATHVRDALATVDGVLLVDLPSWKSESVRVITEAQVSKEKLAEAVKRAGYTTDLVDERISGARPVMILFPKQSGYDIVVIGTGGAGVAASVTAAELGYRVALVERGVIGGTCVNIGCVPSKVLVRAAASFHNAKNNPFRGVETRSGTVSWNLLVQQKDELVASLRQEKYVNVINAYSDKITLLRGDAKLTSDGRVILDGKEELSPSRIVIATGARPRLLQVEGMSGTEILTSTSLMELDRLPKSLLVIGGRSIALELGQALSRFGTKVTILQRSNTVIPAHEPEIAEALAGYLREEGLDIVTGVSVVSISGSDRKRVVAEVDGERREFTAEQILMAVGRTPNTQNMGLEDAGVELDENGFIRVDSQMRTSNEKVLAAGDVTTLPKFVYVAAASGSIASENALTASARELDLTALPGIIFTSPQVATVGLTEAEAKAAGHNVTVSLLPFKHVPRAIVAHDIRGLIKLVADVESNVLLGAHVLAEEAGEVIQTAAMAIRMGAEHGFTVSDLQRMLFPYLVQVEGLKLAALAFDKDVSKLSCCAG